MIFIAVFLIYTFVVGVLYCFYGKKYFYSLMALYIVVGSVESAILSFGGGVLAVIVGISAGLLLALLARIFYRFGLFIIGGAAGGALGMLVSGILLGFLGVFSWPIVLVISLIFAIYAAVKSGEFVVVLTAFVGASMIVSVVGMLMWNYNMLGTFVSDYGAADTMRKLSLYLTGDFIVEHTLAVTVATVILFVIGLSFQNRQKRQSRY